MDLEKMPSTSQLDQLYRRIGDDLERRTPRIENSEIAEFFAGKTLFVTGATGFMGKCLVEKLLRGCPRLEHLYILMRERNNAGMRITLEKYLAHPIFRLLRATYPNFEKKVTAIKGDLLLENLGISPEDRSTLVNRVNIVYHSAANVKFDARVKDSLTVNVLGTKFMLDLAEECRRMELFVYISSAYSHCYRRDIDETFYAMPDSLDTVYEVIRRNGESEAGGMSEEDIKALLGKFPNVYTYTKAFSEELVRRYGEKNPNFALGIYRPSIVISSYTEPLAGWCGNTNGPVYFFLAVGLGVVRTGYYLEYPMDFIPVDMTINALLALTWDLGTRWKPMDKPSIYNYGSSTLNPAHLRPFYDNIKNRPDEASAKAVWINAVTACKSLYLFWLLHVLLHFIPACLGDLVLVAMGRKAMFVSIFFRVTKQMDKIIYFSNGNWKIHCPETMRVVDRMNYDDKELFYCDIRTLSWTHYVFIMWRGMRYFILKEDLDSKVGRRKYIQHWYMHYGLLTLLIVALCYYALKMFDFLP